MSKATFVSALTIALVIFAGLYASSKVGLQA